ncbi:TetR/AcrR family transcriptional regulator [Pseudoscardovia suis]|uniref:HTH tetR-type domain-containing protein n=1 Tax=Pseudoscardovia suis TaxID=987063 RepID=A0A261F185_9BIFI|nr:TetR/AcrR family transcriptional regulator [Pseudoscardovia suis]OZG52835.1 hypothetical protein PSSU_0453 [Pseudoscardovia suis]PJJ68339.1 hypothetical protein CLV65_0914 [Pseudoscardovia suis]
MYRNAERSLTALHKAFESLLLSKPVNRISVTDVATKANLTRNTFYSYYSSIDDLTQSFFRREHKLIDLIETRHLVFDARHPAGLVAACAEYIFANREPYATLLDRYRNSPNYQWLISTKIRNVYDVLVERMAQQKIKVEECDKRFVSFTVVVGYSLMYQLVTGGLDVSQEQLTKSYLGIVQPYCAMLTQEAASLKDIDPLIMLVCDIDVARKMATDTMATDAVTADAMATNTMATDAGLANPASIATIHDVKDGSAAA